MLETLRPAPTFSPSPRLAMEAEVEHLAYTVLLSPDKAKPDALEIGRASCRERVCLAV